MRFLKESFFSNLSVIQKLLEEKREELISASRSLQSRDEPYSEIREDLEELEASISDIELILLDIKKGVNLGSIEERASSYI